MSHYEEVEAYGRRFADAYHRQDAPALFNILDPDCLLVNPGQATIVGREAVLAQLTSHAQPPPLIEFSIDHYFESGDLAVVHGRAHRAGEAEAMHRYLVVYRRRPDGSLALLVDTPIAD